MEQRTHTNKKKNQITDDVKEEESKQVEIEKDETTLDEFTLEVKNILKSLKQKYPQYHLNGYENIWIIKPAGLSRGRGIKCYQNLVEIQDHISSKEAQWIIQKYIEKPLIIKQRKMDIRQWVLVTEWNPLTIWYFDECYLRFSSQDYDIKDLDNEFQHLTNNSIQKKSSTFHNDVIPENMMFQQDFAHYLKQQTNGRDIFFEQIRPKMIQCVIWSMESMQDSIEHRKNSHEMFGYDFMIDDAFNVWLIEVNSSPAMDYSTRVTEKLVKEVSESLIRVVVDYNLSTKKSRSEIDTGKFICIHKGNNIAEKPISVGLNLCLEGKSIKR